MKWSWILIPLFIWLMLSWFASSVGLADENDTAYSDNLLPNNNTATSNYSNGNLDGVASSTGSLTNNSTHNGFTITCQTQVSNACGQANTSVGEIEGSHDITLSATGSLVGVTGIDDGGNSHTSTQKKLDGGIVIENEISIQNCEWSGSAYQCGNSVGINDKYTLTIKVKNDEGEVIDEVTTIRYNDAGYHGNSRKFTDSLNITSTKSNNFEWSMTLEDGSGSTTTALLGPNLLGAEMKLQFPTDDYEPLTTTEITEINNALGTSNLTENEIWEVVSGIEQKLSEKIYEAGIPEGTKVQVELQENMTVKVYSSGPINEEMVEAIEAVETKENIVAAKQEVIKEVIQEEKSETIATKIIEENAPEEKKAEAKETEPTSEEPTTETVSTENNSKQEKVQSKKEVAAKSETKTSKKNIQNKELATNIDKVMASIDDTIKDVAKNLEVKSIVKLKAMEAGLSLDTYANQEFYIPKDIYLGNNLIDNRKIYNTVSLASYIANDPVNIKDNKLLDININKQRLLLEIEQLKNGT